MALYAPTPMAKRSTDEPNAASKLAMARSVLRASDAAPSVTNTTTVGRLPLRQPAPGTKSDEASWFTAWWVAVAPFTVTGVMARKAASALAGVVKAKKSKSSRDDESKLMAATRESVTAFGPTARGSAPVTLAAKSSICAIDVSDIEPEVSSTNARSTGAYVHAGFVVVEEATAVVVVVVVVGVVVDVDVVVDVVVVGVVVVVGDVVVGVVVDEEEVEAGVVVVGRHNAVVSVGISPASSE